MEPQDKKFGIIGNPAFHSIFLKHRNRGRQYDIDALVDGLRKDGVDVLCIGKDFPRQGFAGNSMLENPPIKRDRDFPLMSFNTEAVMESRPAMKFPHKSGKAIFLSAEDYEHHVSFISRWFFRLKMDKQFDDAIWRGPSYDAIQSPSALYDYKTQRRSGRVMVEESRQEFLPQMFSKGLVAGEGKPVKHNPRPSRFGFLEGLKNHKRR